MTRPHDELFTRAPLFDGLHSARANFHNVSAKYVSLGSHASRLGIRWLRLRCGGGKPDQHQQLTAPSSCNPNRLLTQA